MNWQARLVLLMICIAIADAELSKGIIRFPLSEPVPVKLIERIAKCRAKEVAEREKVKAAAPKKR